MGTSFADKFEEALASKKQEDPSYGLRTLARELAGGDPQRMEVIRRRLNKYRPKPGGGAAEVAPTEPTRHDIEDAMGLDRDALAPDVDPLAARSPMRVESLFNQDALDEYLRDRARDAVARVVEENSAPASRLAGSAAGASTEGF